MGNVGKFLCMSLNYSEYELEAKTTPPKHPILYLKENSANCGVNNNITMHRQFDNPNLESEVGMVIGKTAKYQTKKKRFLMSRGTT